MNSNNLEYLKISEKDFLALMEYSSTIPTGTTIGKRWRRGQRWRDKNGEIKTKWYIGEYVEDPDPKYVGIKWYIPLIEKGGMFC